jgi:hypothetical protein
MAEFSFDVEFIGGMILQSNCIYCNKKQLKTASITINYTGGTIKFYLGLSTDPNTTPTSWEEVTGLTSGVTKNYKFTGNGAALFYKLLKDDNAIIYTIIDSQGRRTKPAIEIKNIITE